MLELLLLGLVGYLLYRQALLSDRVAKLSQDICGNPQASEGESHTTQGG
jgi:hypothetical protein